MKVLAINGSHRAGKSTSAILESILEGFKGKGWETELVELSRCSMEYCCGCNSCLKQRPCPLHDDLDGVFDSLREADAVVLGSPNYFLNVTARMKCFMDRTRPFHLAGDTLSGKVAGIVCTTGLSNAGSDNAISILKRFCDAHGWVTVGGTAVVASWEDQRISDLEVRYRKTAALDPRGIATATKMVEKIDSLCRGEALSSAR